MPNRILKESIRTSRSVNNLSDFEFRVWAYLITYVDDYGRGSADPELLRGLCFPRRKTITEAQISRALSGLSSAGMIHLYSVDGEPYLEFPSWERHQQIRSKRSKFPAPEQSETSDIICNQMQSDDSICPRNPIQSVSVSESESISISESIDVHSAKQKFSLFGEYANVRLTQSDMQSLQSEFPGDWQDRIDRLSEYMSSTGKSYKNHLATIRSWARKDRTSSAGNKRSLPAARAIDADELAAMQLDD